MSGLPEHVIQVGSSCWNKILYNTTNWPSGTAGLGSTTDYDGTSALATQVSNASVPADTTFTLSIPAANWIAQRAAADGFFLRGGELGANTSLSLYSTEHATGTVPSVQIDYTVGGGHNRRRRQ